MTTPLDPLSFIVFNPDGILVRGVHDLLTPAIHPRLSAEFKTQHAHFRRKVLSRPEGFDGARAVLTGFVQSGNVVDIATAFRTYTEGLALKESLRLARIRELEPMALTEASRHTPDKTLSWGMSLSSYVLLPHGHALCSQRALDLVVAPGLWTMNNSEVIEPNDICPSSLQPLLTRVLAEEIPQLQGLGTHKFVGLGLREGTYTWQLIAVADLRGVDRPLLNQALTELTTTPETAAWAAYPLGCKASAEQSRFFPPSLRCPEGVVPDDLSIAQFLYAEVAA